MTEVQLEAVLSELSKLGQKLDNVTSVQESQSEQLAVVQKALFDDDEEEAHGGHHSEGVFQKTYKTVNSRSGIRIISQDSVEDPTQLQGAGFHPNKDSPSLQAGGGSVFDFSSKDLEFKTLENKYETVRDSLSKERIPGDFILSSESSAGITGEDRPKFQIISKTSKYLETGLKWITKQSGKFDDPEYNQDLEELTTILLTAQAKMFKNGIFGVNSAYITCKRDTTLTCFQSEFYKLK